LVLYESRKTTLVEAFGEEGCLTGDSWMIATFQNLNGEFTLYSDDVEFMYNNQQYCIPEEDVVNTTLIVREYNGVSADITIEGEVIGKTNRFIPIEAGNYTATISADGYVPQEIAVIVKDKTSNEYKYVTLIKEEEEPETNGESEYGTVTPLGAILTPTMNNKTPSPIVAGDYNWFGWEFTNTGDTAWKGMVGVKLVDTSGNEFSWTGDTTKRQSIAKGETKYLWAYCLVNDTVDVENIKNIFALLTKTN
jgi:hypothetical protein